MKPRRIVLYGCGGGIGHFNRVYAIARELRRHPQLQPIILTTTPFVPLALAEPIPIWRLPSCSETQSLALPRPRHMQQLLNDLNPHALVVDTFPLGLADELADWLPDWHGIKVLIQRDMTQSPPRDCYQAVFQPDETGIGWILNRQSHELWPRSQVLPYLHITDEQPVILVAHNGEPVETRGFFQQMYYALAEQPWHLRFASLCPIPDPRWGQLLLHHYPLSEWLAGVDLVIGGGGYNLVAECRVFGKRRLLRAFERPIDRQADRLHHEPHFFETTPAVTLREWITGQLTQPPPEPSANGQGAQFVVQWLQTALLNG